MPHFLQVIRHLKRVLPNGPQRKREVDHVLDRISETMTPMHYHSREVIFSTFNLVSELSNVSNTSSSVLSGFKTTRRSRVVLDPIKHVLRVF